MKSDWHDTLALLGRILIAAIFLMSGLNKIMAPGQTQGYMAQFGIPLTGPLLVGAILLEVGGGLSILLGAFTFWGSLALLIFMIPTTLIFHTNFADPNQVIHFMKNLAITGGILYVMEAGPGRISVDAKRKPESARRIEAIARRRAA
ncbi:MAG: DoxX family protein [Candidatus Manganitrophaceae bacterium]|nr:MAG: DoxX family protein [Candidatus Manganitrophaceae bacterium]